MEFLHAFYIEKPRFSFLVLRYSQPPELRVQLHEPPLATHIYILIYTYSSWNFYTASISAHGFYIPLGLVADTLRGLILFLLLISFQSLCASGRLFLP